MPDFEALANDVYCVDAHYVKPGVASIYLVREGDEVAIVETGTRHSLDNVSATLAQLGIDDDQVRYVIPTHVHLDHAGGAGAMMQRFSQAELIVHPRGLRHMIDPSKLVDGTIAVYGRESFERLYGSIEPIAEARIIVAEDSSSHWLGGRELVFIDTPGHAYHHFCIYDDRSRGVFTGDTFGVSYAAMKSLPGGLIPTTPPTQFDPPALRDSIERIMQFRPERLYLTHYGEFENPAAQVDSFDRWIDLYVTLAESYDAIDDAQEAELEDKLLSEVLNRLGVEHAEALKPVVGHDIRLNAQGLAWWRNRAQHA